MLAESRAVSTVIDSLSLPADDNTGIMHARRPYNTNNNLLEDELGDNDMSAALVLPHF